MEGAESSGSYNASDNNKVTKKTSNKIKDKITTTFVRYVIPRPVAVWRKFSIKRKQKRISRRIDQDLKKEEHGYCEVLVLGEKASGKTTICKQMKILYGNKFSDAEKQKFSKIIEKNIKEGILNITSKAFKTGNLNTGVKEVVSFIANYNFKFENRRKFFFCVEILWNNPHLQAFLQNLDETQIVVTTKYFINKIGILKPKDYLPTNEDILRCYEPSKAALEIKFKSGRFYYKMSEIPNLQYGKSLWRQIANGILVIILVIPINTFLEVRNKKTNPFTDALVELETLERFDWLSRSIICLIFLNKEDLFTEHILKSSVNLEECFPGFSEDKGLDGSRECAVTKVKDFILSAFTKAAKVNERWYRCYIHFTCAINSEDTANVYQKCQFAIQNSYRFKLSLL